jgi:hypothetical protein
MGLGAQVTGADTPLWRVIFVIGAAFGIIFTTRILGKTKTAEKTGPFRRNRWAVIVIYVLILLGSLGLDKLLAAFITPIQVEAFMMCLLILIGHGLAWEFLTETQPASP